METYRLYPKNTDRAKFLSDTITFLKFPLAVLVVVLHSDLSTKPYECMGITSEAISAPCYANLSWFFSRYLAYAAVPCFFVISGFLLFYNVQNYNKSKYLEKLQKRCKSLMLPYTVWCLIYLLLYRIIGQENFVLSQVPNLFDGSLSPIGFIYTLFIKPLDGPLWFIRNLFMMVVLSPIFYIVIKKTKYALPISLLILTQIVHSPIVESILWFSFGISFALNNFDFLFFCRKWIAIILLIVIASVVFDVAFYNYFGFHISSYFTIFKIMGVFGIGYWLVTLSPKISQNTVLNNASFTIYAYHGLAVMLLPPIIYNLVNPMGGAIILTYFLTIVIVVIIGVVLSVLINKNHIIKTILCGR